MDVSLPMALGITIVLSPKGIAREHNEHIKTSFDIEKNLETITNTKGIKTSLIIEITYILIFVNAFFREMDDTIIPVSTMAIGDIQSPETVMIF